MEKECMLKYFNMFIEINPKIKFCESLKIMVLYLKSQISNV